jgi:MerR family mercuric resistance operon transcriptional regulator
VKECSGTRRRPSAAIKRTGADRLRFTKRSQSLGFSLDEVEVLLSLHDGQVCNSARAIAEPKLVDVRQRIQDLYALEVALATLVQRCSRSKGNVSCPLIDALMEDSEPAHSRR